MPGCAPNNHFSWQITADSEYQQVNLSAFDRAAEANGMSI